MTQRLRILVVEPEQSGVDELRSKLRRWDGDRFELLHASSLREVQDTPTEHLDAVLLDIEERGASLNALREVRLLHDKPVVVRHAEVDQAMGITAMQIGAQDVFRGTRLTAIWHAPSSSRSSDTDVSSRRNVPR